MSFALSSIVRTRQKKTFFSLFILTLLLFYPSGSVLASSEENTDSMDVHPTNRWTETNVGFTVSVDESLLNIGDIGDGSDDYYQIERDLRDVDGIIEVRFKYDTNESSTAATDQMLIAIANSDLSDYIIFLLEKPKAGSYADTSFFYRDTTDTTRQYLLSGSERVYDDLWYILRIDYDLLKSDYRARLYFDNGSKVFDYHEYDISTVYRMQLFQESSINVWIKSRLNTATIETELLVDYVKAPFKEREWTNSNVPSGFLSNSWQACSAEDNIDDISIWDLTVPYFDTVSGVLVANIDDYDALAIGEEMIVFFLIFTVDSDDGDITAAVNLQLIVNNQFAVGVVARCQIFIDSILEMNQSVIIEDDNYYPRIDFSFGTSQDRSKLTGQITFNPLFPNNTGQFPSLLFSKSFTVDLSDVSATASQEFVLETAYDFDFDGDTEMYGYVYKLTVLERGIFQDWWMDIAPGLFQPLAEDLVGGVDFFTAIFRWIGNLISIAFEIVIGVLIFALEAALGLIKLAIEALEPFLTAISDAIDDLVAFIQAIGEDVIDYLISIAGAFIEAFFDALILLIDAAADVIFAFWNAIGLPDILAIANELLAYIIELIDWTLATFLDVVQLAADLSWIILVFWWIWALPVQWARAEGNPLAGLGNFIEVFFYDAFPWSFLGIHLYVPQGIIFTLWMILLLPETFILFTALGL